MNKKKIVAVDDVRRVKYFLHILRIFQSESLANLKEWDELLEVIAVTLLCFPMCLVEALTLKIYYRRSPSRMNSLLRLMKLLQIFWYVLPI